MLLLIDNYDSFTYNLLHYLGSLGADVVVRRNDALAVQQAMAMRPAGILLSPGPCDPDQAGICLALTQAAAETRTPLLGVCLGHQTIGQAFGGKIVRAKKLMHGKTSPILHDGVGVFDYNYSNVRKGADMISRISSSAAGTGFYRLLRFGFMNYRFLAQTQG